MGCRRGLLTCRQSYYLSMASLSCAPTGGLVQWLLPKTGTEHAKVKMICSWSVNFPFLIIIYGLTFSYTASWYYKPNSEFNKIFRTSQVKCRRLSVVLLNYYLLTLEHKLIKFVTSCTLVNVK